MTVPSSTNTNTNTAAASPPPRQHPRHRHVTPPPPPRTSSYGHNHNHQGGVRVYGSPHNTRPHFNNNVVGGSILGPAPGPLLQQPLLFRGIPIPIYHQGGAVASDGRRLAPSMQLTAVPSPTPAPAPAPAPVPVPVPDGTGYKEPRSKDDSFVTVRDRKVSVSGSSSLYAGCRSWLRNGVSEETQPHYLDGIKLLPKPLPPPVPDAHSPAEQEPNKEEEKEEESVEHLSAKELLMRHVKRAKKVRAGLREERLQRIARYKTRLALLLPPVADQQNQFRNESGAGN